MSFTTVKQEMALLSQKNEPIGNANLEKWEFIASGGFGDVYKARHKAWGFGVAIKLIHNAACSPSNQLSHSNLVRQHDETLHEEAEHMGKVSCEFVLRVYGMYQGIPPTGRGLMQQGIVIELMERGSIQTLQTKLQSSPPMPLAVRLAHQVALGMNFLHSREIIHHDLKPSNVLLTEDLNAKLADFGLSRVSTSVLNVNGKTTEMIGGSYKYMPPEAFEMSYKPVRAFDRYSYGILLWSIFSGKEPYPGKDYSIVAFLIPKNSRPCCDQLNNTQELEEVIELMKRCWDKNPDERPTFRDCLEITEKLLLKYKKELPDAVCSILKTLESPASDEQHNTSVAFNIKTATPVSKSNLHDIVNHPQFTAQQSSGGFATKILTTEEKAKFVKDNFLVLVQEVSEVTAIVDELGDMVYREVRSEVQTEKISQDKMRLLYSKILNPAGGRVKAAFYDALAKHHPSLVEKLGGYP